jgi:S1-C subfamily serine protease
VELEPAYGAWLVLVATAFLIGGCIVYALMQASRPDAPGAAVHTDAKTPAMSGTLLEMLKRETPSPPAGESLSAEAVFKKASPAVVLVEVRLSDSRIRQGSGFLVTADGMIATNYHVIRGGVEGRVVFGDDSRHPVEGVAATDSGSDLALLKIEGRFPFLERSVSALPAIGSKVFAIGSPKGLTNSLSDGVVSGHRQFGEGAPTLIQTTAPISPGSSGGPLLATDGKVLGVTTIFSSGDAHNLNLAVPVEKLSQLLLSRRSLVTLAAASRDEAPRWTREEKVNLVHFFRALRWERDFARILDQVNPPLADQLAYAAGVKAALGYARRVRGKVLDRVHPDLEREFSRFVRFMEFVAGHFDASEEIPPQTWELLAKWGSWWEENKKDLRFPAEVPVRRGDDLNDEWASTWKGVRFPKFVPE